MKIRFALLLLSLTQLAHASNSLDYAEMRHEIISGHQVRIVADLSRCSVIEKTGKAISSGIGAYTPNEMMIKANGQIDGSLLHFISSSHYPSQAVYQHVHYSTTADNHMQITVKLLDALSYRPLEHLAKFDCKLNAGATVYSVN